MMNIQRLEEIVSLEEQKLLKTSQDYECQSSCLAILDALGLFFESWKEKMEEEEENDHHHHFQRVPKVLLRDTFSLLLTYIGPGNAMLQERIPKWLLIMAKIPDCRQILLDVLPMIRSREEDDEQATITQMVHTAKQILVQDSTALFPVLDFLSTFTLTIGKQQQQQQQQNEAFYVALDSLSLVPKAHLHLFIERFVTYVTDDDEANVAIEAIRFEFRTMEEQIMELQVDHETEASHNDNHDYNGNGNENENIDDEVMDTGDSTTAPLSILGEEGSFSAAQDERKMDEKSMSNEDKSNLGHFFSDSLYALLSALIHASNRTLLLQAYIHALKQAVEEMIEKPTPGQERSEDNPFLLVSDLAVLLVLRDDAAVAEPIEAILDTMISNSLFSFRHLKFLMRFITKIHTSARSNESNDSAAIIQSSYAQLYHLLMPPLTSISIFLLLSPIRMEGLEARRIFILAVQDFTVNLLQCLDGDCQRRLILSLFHLSDDLTRKTSSTAIHMEASSQMPSSVNSNQSSELEAGAQLTIHGVYDIFVSVRTVAKRNLFILIQPFMNYLTRRSSIYITQNVSILQKCCLILSSLIEEEKAGESDSTSCTEDALKVSSLLVVLRRLLFSGSSCMGDGDSQGVALVIRGLVLATEIIQIPSVLSETERSTIVQWTRRILLPPGRRMVNPIVGIHGLRFLAALRDSSIHSSPSKGGDDSSSENLKQVGDCLKLVLANTGLVQPLSYYDQRKNHKLALAYTKPPLLFSLDQATPKARGMVFSVSFFLQEQYMVVPGQLSSTSRWAYVLLNTYLASGRSSTKKWIPHGWLEAGIEFPILNMPGKKSSNKRQAAVLKWIQTRIGNLEITAESLPNLDFVERDARDLVSLCSDGKTVAKLLRSLQRTALSLAIGLGLSSAVLQNTLEHYRQILTMQVRGNAIYDVAMRLMQYQLVKIYDMMRKCRALEQVFSSLKSSLRRNKPLPRVTKKDEAIQSSKDAVSENLQKCCDSNKEFGHSTCRSVAASK